MLLGCNMNFKEYLEFVEAMTLSAEDLDFNVREDSVICNFNHDGNKFTVRMNRGRDGGVDYVWSVNFEGPAGYRTTKMSGSSSTAVYNKLLSCVRKLFATQKVNGLKFSPAETHMTIPYDLFYRSFLRPDPPLGAGFLMVTPNVYLAKDKVKELDLVTNVLPANRMQMAKVELIKIDKAISRIYDRINRGTGFVTDRKTLDDLESKRNEIANKFRNYEKDYNYTLKKNKDRQEAARIAAERELDRVREEEKMERKRVRAAKVERMKTLQEKVLVMKDSLPPSTLVRQEIKTILASAPWISIQSITDDSAWILFGNEEMDERVASRLIYFDEAEYIISNFVVMSEKKMRKTARRIYSALLKNPQTASEEGMSRVLSILPEDLRTQVRKIGPLARGIEFTKNQLKNMARDVFQVPMDTYRYWSGKPDPEETRARERRDIW